VAVAVPPAGAADGRYRLVSPASVRYGDKVVVLQHKGEGSGGVQLMVHDEGIRWWRARAYTQARQPNPRTGRWAGTELFGFRGPDSHQAVGTPVDLAGLPAGLRNGLDLTEVLAARQQRGRFGVVLEVEPYEGGPPGPRPPELVAAAEVRVPRGEAQASSGNGGGIFDAACGYGRTRGEEGGLVGPAEQVAEELAALLAALTRGDVEAMRSGTARYFVELLIVPGTETGQGRPGGGAG
jgi:hypothetical protein